MIESLYSNARLYDLMYPEPSGVSSKVGFYLDLAAAARRPVLELACGTGSLLLPIVAQGIACEGSTCQATCWPKREPSSRPRS
jgi:hypothetical protein